MSRKLIKPSRKHWRSSQESALHRRDHYEDLKGEIDTFFVTEFRYYPTMRAATKGRDLKDIISILKITIAVYSERIKKNIMRSALRDTMHHRIDHHPHFLRSATVVPTLWFRHKMIVVESLHRVFEPWQAAKCELRQIKTHLKRTEKATLSHIH